MKIIISFLLMLVSLSANSQIKRSLWGNIPLRSTFPSSLENVLKDNNLKYDIENEGDNVVIHAWVDMVRGKDPILVGFLFYKDKLYNIHYDISRDVFSDPGGFTKEEVKEYWEILRYELLNDYKEYLESESSNDELMFNDKTTSLEVKFSSDIYEVSIELYDNKVFNQMLLGE